jgi:hypothetical protein
MFTADRLMSSVPDQGSGAFLAQGSGMEKKSGSGMNIPDHFSESLETVLGLKIFNFFDADPIWNLFDPRAGIRKLKIRIRDPGSYSCHRTV